MGEGAQGRGAELSGGRDWARRDGVERARRDMVWTALARAVCARGEGCGVDITGSRGIKIIFKFYTKSFFQKILKN